MVIADDTVGNATRVTRDYRAGQAVLHKLGMQNQDIQSKYRVGTQTPNRRR
jgi:hypothetical protein